MGLLVNGTLNNIENFLQIEFFYLIFRVISMVIYKVFKEEEFLELEKKRISYGSLADEMDGFIHLSTKNQLLETLKKHFHGQKNLILMAIDSDTIHHSLRWEKSRHGQLFPHLYSGLSFNDALWFAPIEFAKNQHIIPSGV